MRSYFIAALVAASFAASAQVASNGKDWVRLSKEPCTRVNAPDKAERKAASAFVDGKPYFACWRPLNGQIHLVYEDGDQGLIPLHDFQHTGPDA
jgi:hypothetical protein